MSFRALEMHGGGGGSRGYLSLELGALRAPLGVRLRRDPGWLTSDPLERPHANYT